MYMSFSEINAERKKPLDYKIKRAEEAIEAGFEASKQKCALAFSGGKDSTVLWHLIRTKFPEREYEVIFGNTGVEFPESLEFARRLGKEWGGNHFHEVRPERITKDGLKYQAQKEVMEYLEKTGQLDKVLKADGKLKSTECLERACPAEKLEDFKRRNLIWKAGTRKNYFWCVDQYGYPILGKAVSGKLTARRINVDCFLKYSQSTSTDSELLDYYELLRHVKLSNHCCAILKKEPSEKLQAELGVDVIFKGLMASESQMRNLNFCTRGYLFRSSRSYCGDFYHCSPLSIWTDEDIWEYIHKYDVPYSKLYDKEYTNSRGERCKIKRNGCIGCATDIAFRDNHMSSLRQTHPRHWETFMIKSGMADELKRLREIKGDGKIKRIDYYQKAEQLSLFAPCALDSWGLVEDAVTMAEYDPEDDLPGAGRGGGKV